MKKLTVFKNSSNMHSVTRATSTSHITSVIFSYNLRNFFSAGKRGGGGGKKKPPPPPQLIIRRLSSGNAPNGLIFHDFVPFNIRKVLGRPFLGFLFEKSKKFYVDNFFHIQSKGGTLLCLGSNPLRLQFFLSFFESKMVIIQLQMHK